MRIGIVTPAFNVAPFIGAAIESVLSQTYRDWRMVVVDDGSTDETASVVRSFRDYRLQLISQPNEGVSAARNRGAAALSCDALLFLDGDDWLAPFALAALAGGLVDGAVASVGAYQRGGTVCPPASGHLLRRLLVRNLFVNGGHVLIRRSAAGLFVGIGLRFGIVRFDFRDGIDPVAMVGDAIQLQIIHVFEGNRQFPRIGLIGIMRAAVDG